MANENDIQWSDSDKEEGIEEQDSAELEENISEDEIQDEDSQAEYETDEEDDGSSQSGGGRKVLFIVIIAAVLLLLLTGILFLVKHFSAGGSNEAAPAAVSQQADDGFADAFFEDNASDAGNADMANVDFNTDDSITASDSGAENREASSENAPGTDAGAAKLEGNNSDVFEQTANDAPAAAPDAGALLSEEEKMAENIKEENKLLENLGNSHEEGAGSSIMVTWNAQGRQNPFKAPAVLERKYDNYEQVGNVQFEIIEPPSKLVPDENLTRLLQTQISGILYDSESPSAIVNLAGKDYFVKIGDKISVYLVKRITETKVEISYKNNTYIASVGELFTPGSLDKQSEVANLKSKFAGRYKNENIEE